MTPGEKTLELLRYLAGKPGHDEVKAGVKTLLIDEFGAEHSQVDFERRVPEVKGRIDALVGRTVFEVKSDLKRERADVERKMPDYLAAREAEEKEKFVGVASDGLHWAAYELKDGALDKISETVLKPDEAEQFLAWLDGVVAVQSSLPPDAINIRAELGRDSVAYRRVDAGLRALWMQISDQPDIALKRQLWADLLRQVYGKDVDDDALWFQHTFLVVVAKCIAFSVMDLHEDDPVKLLSGEVFTRAGVNGAVESDFFDWAATEEEGRELVRRVMKHVRRFRLKDVKSDVLKILYESLVSRDERHGLGEYYTPDWLAAKIVRRAVSNPLTEHVMDPACGSGTFLFHSVRRFLDEAEDAGMAESDRAGRVCEHVAGLDIHPVAVIIARVTYLLALAPVLQARSGEISIPVYLGDSLQLSTNAFMTGKEMVIRVPPSPAASGRSSEIDANGREQLDFPENFCRDPGLFDKTIEEMRSGAEAGLKRSQIERALHRIVEQHCRAPVTKEQKEAISDLGKTYVTFDRLRREGRDSVWAYVARNLSRPLAYSASGGWASVLVGNPPWLAFRHMNKDLQQRFKELSKGEKVYVSAIPSHNDMCALFVARSLYLYLRSGGRLAMVLPIAALTRSQFEKFRTGSYRSARIAWDEAWTMDDSVQPLFPVPSCVVIGRRRATAKPLPDKVHAYSGVLPIRDADESMADRHLSLIKDAPAPKTAQRSGGSAYRKLFRQGAVFSPRMFWLINREFSGYLGASAPAPSVKSRRTSLDKKPWKNLRLLEGNIEAEFLRPVLLGASILPYHIWQKFEVVSPIVEDKNVLDSEKAANFGFSNLSLWLQDAEKCWLQNRNSEKRSLKQQLNYINQFSSQFPIAPLRVVYTTSGTFPAACVVRDKNAVIDYSLYWSAPSSVDEANFLCAVFNSETLRVRTKQYQVQGQWGARHFDKAMFNAPIPLFEKKQGLHEDLAKAGVKAEKLAAKVELPEGVKFQRARKLVREALADAGISKEIDALVTRLLDKT